MKYLFFILFLFLAGNSLFAQNNSKFSIEVNYGLNGNFFVRSYDESNGPNTQINLLKKNFIGSIGGGSLKFHLGSKSTVFAEYGHSTNKGRKSYEVQSGAYLIQINDFNIRHTNNLYSAGYEYSLPIKNLSFKIDGGVTLLTSSQQEIEIDNWNYNVLIDERNNHNSKLAEGGIFLGSAYNIEVGSGFEFGIKARVYYLVSTGTFEMVSLTPVLSYRF